MTKVLVTGSVFTDIADAIRAKLGVQTTYKPSQMAAAIGSIVGAVLQSKTATPSASDQTIQPDSGYNGLSSVLVSGDSDLVAGNIKKDVNIFGVTGTYEGSGGGGGTQSISKSDWDALTKTQKKSYGLVNIITSSSGYKRGLLVNGSDYSYAQTYLPYSDDSYVDCVACYENFNSNELAWGDGDSPVSMSTACTRYQSEDAVYFDAKTSQKQIRIPLGGTQTDFTVYVVAKGISYSGGDVIVFGSVNSWGNNNLIMLYHRTGATWITSIYGSDLALIDTNGGYVAIAIRSSNMKASWFAHDGASRKDVTYNNHGEYFTFGYYRTTYSTDLAVKFVGYVSHAETDLAIQNNLANLAEIYSLS